MLSALTQKREEGHKEILEMMEVHYLDCGDGFMGVCIYPTQPVLYTKHLQCFVYPLYLNICVVCLFFF